MTPFPHQIEGANFLASKRAALLADDPRVGKTGSALLACKQVNARKILIVTTNSGRPNWEREVKEWGLPHKILTVYTMSTTIPDDRDVVIVSWHAISNSNFAHYLALFSWDVMILDEAHYAKSFETKRTVNAYYTLAPRCSYVWCLTGTPIIKSPEDVYPMLKAIAPERLEKTKDFPCVLSYPDFATRYCVFKKGYIKNKVFTTVVAAKNLSELKTRLSGFFLRRTQKQAGITKPIYENFSLRIPSDQMSILKHKLAPYSKNAVEIISSLELGENSKENSLAEVRKIVGLVKAQALAEAIKEELESYDKQLVIMAWHHDVIEYLAKALEQFKVATLTGKTPAKRRQEIVDGFRNGDTKIFIGQIAAAGEAIDLSSASDLIFAELSFSPKDMHQASLRVTNANKIDQPVIRVCGLEGSIDAVLAKIITRKVKIIRSLL
jgi:SNF2 family DNA or RNA helicase